MMSNEYKGEERRQSVFTAKDMEVLTSLASIASKQEKEFKVAGFRIPELVVIFTVLFGIFAFYLRTNATLTSLEKFQEYTSVHISNSDAYHSEAVGTYFKQGKPLDPNFDYRKIREILNGVHHEPRNP